MYKKILIATDGSDLGTRAVVHGLQLANKLGNPVVFVTVSQIWSPMEMAHQARLHKTNPIEHFEEMAAKSASAILDAASKQANIAGVTCEMVHIPDKTPAEGIIGTATEKGCGLIVMASHGRRTVGRLLLGSQVNEVLSHSKIPMLVVH